MQDFLRALRDSGELTVSAEPPAELDDRVAEALREHEAALRSELPPGAPELHPEAAHWGAQVLYQSCQLFTMRDAPPAAAKQTLCRGYEGRRSPSVDYSVDLTFSYLPSLFALATRVAPADPVLDVVREVAFDWPLSSVGIEDLSAPSELPFWENDCLRALYLDRVIERRALDRLDDPLVARGVRARIGAYPELATKIAERLEADPRP